MWRRMRMLVLESVTLDTQLTAFGCTATADLNQTAHAFSTLAKKDGTFELIHRYESRYLRAFERAGRSLIAYRKFRSQQESLAEESTPTPTPTPEPETKKERNEPKPTPTAPTGRGARRLRRWQKRHPAPQANTKTAEPHPQPPSQNAE